MQPRPVRFSVIGIDHGHIYGQVRHVLEAGGELVSFHAVDDSLALPFQASFGGVRRSASAAEILEDETVELILTAGIPAERAELGLRVMEHDKDFMTDKPGMTTLGQLDRVVAAQASSKRIYSICFSEHFNVRAVVKAGELVAAGAIGTVVQTVGLGPHQANLGQRPPWFFQRDSYGGILNDLGSHQAEQFLFLTGSTTAHVVSAQVANYRYPDHPGLEDWGEMSLLGEGGHGYARVDWYTPDTMTVFGDGRLFVLGTDGYIEVRKYIDPAGRPDGDHLLLVNNAGITYIDCRATPLPYGAQLVADVRDRTETAIPQSRT